MRTLHITLPDNDWNNPFYELVAEMKKAGYFSFELNTLTKNDATVTQSEVQSAEYRELEADCKYWHDRAAELTQQKECAATERTEWLEDRLEAEIMNKELGTDCDFWHKNALEREIEELDEQYDKLNTKYEGLSTMHTELRTKCDLQERDRFELTTKYEKLMAAFNILLHRPDYRIVYEPLLRETT